MGKQEEEPKQKRTCPLLGEPCIEDKCAWYMRIQHQQLGLGKIIGTCALVALVLISSTPPRQAPPNKGITLPPGMGRG